MVSKLLETKSKEIETCHEGPKKEEDKLEIEHKDEPEMGE
jgi:hypothetical protein